MEKIVLKARLEDLNDVISFVRKIAGAQGFEQQLFQIELAAEEIFINIAQYAYSNGEGTVEMSCGAEGDVFTMEFADRGIPFNPLEYPLPDTDAPADERPMGGLGIYMAKQYMDEASYAYTDGWNRLTLVKHKEKCL